jgi:hypothetical protein
MPISRIKNSTKPLEPLPIDLEQDTSLEVFNIMIARLKRNIKQRLGVELSTGVKDLEIDDLEDKLEDMKKRRDASYPSQTTTYDDLDADVDVVGDVGNVGDTEQTMKDIEAIMQISKELEEKRKIELIYKEEKEQKRLQEREKLLHEKIETAKK